MTTIKWATLLAATAALLLGNAPGADTKPADTQQVLVLVDKTVYPQVRRPLATYFGHVRARHRVEFVVLAKPWYERTPPEIRAALKQAYDTMPCVVGAILIGDIPYATYQHGDGAINPAPFFYEDFEAKWVNDDEDDHFERVETDTTTNPTEIWTAWWVPPTNDRAEQAAMLAAYLGKLDRYYRGELEGSGGGIFMTSEMNNPGFTKSWAAAAAGLFEGSGQPVTVWSRFDVADGTVKPAFDEDFRWAELNSLLAERRLKVLHVFCHGLPDGFYWSNKTFAWQGAFDCSRFKWFAMCGTGANFVTSSGCSNGNFRGSTGETPVYDRSIANFLIFSPETCTTAFYGSVSPQSTALFPAYFKEVYEGLRSTNGSYLGFGYLRMRNADHVWGTTHYFFRGVDDKALLGDPFITLDDGSNEPRGARGKSKKRPRPHAASGVDLCNP